MWKNDANGIWMDMVVLLAIILMIISVIILHYIPATASSIVVLFVYIFDVN